MRAVHKFSAVNNGFVRHTLAGQTFKPLALQMQDGIPWIWAEVDPSEEQCIRHTVAIVGTGHPVPQGLDWIATAQDDPFVWHLYGVRA